ncbi:MAG TPA: hypothetical protein DCX27_14375 [Balneola sp.]|nr:hypothetical protein [Balneola sp.]|tara:strand:+ start:365 stop:556 length:192 start_codon:yes stop_codon:yes gene_type:complete
MKIYPFLPTKQRRKERHKELELELPVPQHNEIYEEATTAPTGSDRGVCIIDMNEDMTGGVIID